jgi:hypothetical protein
LNFEFREAVLATPSFARLHTWDFEADTVKAIARRNVEHFVIA